jgi:hypothetical protein
MLISKEYYGTVYSKFLEFGSHKKLLRYTKKHLLGYTSIEDYSGKPNNPERGFYVGEESIEVYLAFFTANRYLPPKDCYYRCRYWFKLGAIKFIKIRGSLLALRVEISGGRFIIKAFPYNITEVFNQNAQYSNIATSPIGRIIASAEDKNGIRLGKINIDSEGNIIL